MLTLKYADKCKIVVNAFKKYDLCGKIIELNTLSTDQISGCCGIVRALVPSVNSVNKETGESGYE